MTDKLFSMANDSGHLIVLASITDGGAAFTVTLKDAEGAEAQDVVLDGADMGALAQFAYTFLVDQLGEASAVRALLEGSL